MGKLGDNFFILFRFFKKYNTASFLKYLGVVFERVILISPSYFFYIRNQNHSKEHSKNIFINIKEIYYSRYLYLLVKFFDIAGYKVFLPKNFLFFYQLKADQFTALLLQEKLICFISDKEKKTLFTTKSVLQFNPNYFRDFYLGGTSKRTHHIPITQHPHLYAQNLWDIPIDFSIKRKNACFMVGTFDEQYHQIQTDGVFDVHSRIEILEYLKKSPYYLSIKTLEELYAFLQSTVDYKIIIINTADFKIPMEDLRPILAQFNFFLALPGAVMPHCHNIVEALSVGCIPIIQDTYAQLWRPNLQDYKHTFTFQTLDGLIRKVEDVFEFSATDIEELRESVLDYYNQFYLPEKVIDHLLETNAETIYLCAEHYSVELLKGYQ